MGCSTIEEEEEEGGGCKWVFGRLKETDITLRCQLVEQLSHDQLTRHDESVHKLE
jgi:hypothetical protein